MSGGFRWPWLARVTKGRFGMGRWTQEEIDGINERAREKWERIAPYIDDDDMTPEEFDRRWAEGEPVEVVIPEGGIKRSRPAPETTGTYCSIPSHLFTWTPERGFQRRT